ncbi:TniB family NTP-binding protein [Pseudomonas shirazica]|uniref:TniB family NTP-binding protein n=1 Tax=Pseudomonas shirazica TaxID=1940636 RepID=UPI0015D627E7|nr:TniB family NTP-binding protein [Pseudomonas shirazica]
MDEISRNRLSSFKRFTIGHPAYNQAIVTIHKSIEATNLRGEAAGTLLMGVPGTGKTRVCTHISSEFGGNETKHTELDVDNLRPVLYCKVPNNCTVKGLIVSLLTAFQAARTYGDATSLEHRLRVLLERHQTKLIILDELQHLLQKGSLAAKKGVCDCIKDISDYFNGELVLAGTPNFEAVIAEHSALSGRFPYRAKLTEFSLATPTQQGEYMGLLAAFDSEIRSSMGFAQMVSLTDVEMALALYALTKGNLREIRTILFCALSEAFNRGDGNFTRKDFSNNYFHVPRDLRLSLNNPFEMTYKQLNKVIVTSTRNG